MTNDELKAHWSANIDSQEKFQQAFNRTRNWLPRTWQQYAGMLPQRDSNTGLGLAHEPEDVWPLQRDIIRESVGFYPEPTTVLKWMRSIHSNIGLGQMFPHVSPINKEEIAFTPDATQAKADRKQRMSVGRFLRKFLLFVNDAEIQRLDQQHRAELNDEFELAETIEAIREVYVGMAGDSGCMRYEESHFNHRDYHPSAVYSSPGMGVAYTKDADGVIKSRSVVWVNPADPGDKRYVRVYGDVILKKKLERKGYQMRGLVGAKLTILRDSRFADHESANTIVMPWIDPAGGIHATNADRSYDSEHAVRFKGEDYITLVSSTQAANYQRAGIYPVNVQSQNGHVDVPEVDTSTFHYTCALSGTSTNRMDVATVYWIAEDGTVQQAREKIVLALPSAGLANLRIFREGSLKYAYCLQQTKDKFAIPGFTSHYNDEPTRDAAGLAMLDKAFYPDSERYHIRSECVAMTDAEGNNLYIKGDDALLLHMDDGSSKYIHIDMVKAMKSEGCVPVAVLNGFRGLAHKDHKMLVVTRGGKRVIRGRHDVTQMWDGTWEYTRNVVAMTVAGISISVGKAENKRDIVMSAEYVAQRYEHNYNLEDREFRKKRMVRDMSRGFEGGVCWQKSGDNIVTVDYYNKVTEPERIYEAALGIMAMSGDSEWMQRVLGYNRQNAVPWARVVVAAWEGMLAYDKARALEMAEANAVEAAPSTERVIQHLNTLADGDMDRLIAEVDDTLATAVVRRWPRLSGSPDGMGPQRVELPTTTDENGALVPVQVPMEVGQIERFTVHEVVPNFTLQGEPTPMGTLMSPAAAWPVTASERAAATQAMQDDDLLAQLRHAGLAPTVIDEHTDFGAPPFAPLRTGDAQ